MIVTTIDQIKAVITNITADVKYTDFKPYVESAEYWIKQEIIGATIFTKIENNTIGDATLKMLVNKVIIVKMYEAAIPYLDVIQTATGFGIVSDKNIAPASQHRIDRLVSQNAVRLGRETEFLFDYMEDTSTLHTDWKSSPAYSILSDCLIRTAREMKRLAKFEGDRSEFLLLKPSLIALTVQKIHPAIGKEYTEELITKQNGGTLTAADNVILPGIKQALANYAVQNNHIAESFLSDVIVTMDALPESYATYTDSDEKAVREDPGFENTLENPMFVFKGGL